VKIVSNFSSVEREKTASIKR